MAGSTNPFAYGSAKSGNGYYATHPATSPGGGHSGVMGFFGNLGSDIRDMAVGLPTGIVQMAEHPIRGIEAAGHQTWHDWSPLFHGHVGEWGHNFYAHPLGPILDAATLLTAGAGTAGLAAKGLDAAGLAGDSGSAISRLAEYSRGGKLAYTKTAENGAQLPTFEKALSKNPLTRLRQQATHDLLNAHQAHLPKFMHYGSRYDRIANKDLGERRAAFMSQVATYTDAGRKLHGPEALKYRTQVLKHSFNTIKQFAIRHNVADNSFVGKDGETYLRLPKEGDMVFHAIKREPQVGKITAQLKQLRNATTMHAKKLADIRGNLDFNHGIRVTSAGDARKALIQAKKDLADAQAKFQPHTIHATRVKLIESYINKDKQFRSAAAQQARHEIARGKATEGFFRPGKNFEGDMHNFARRYSTAGEKGAVRLKDVETVDGGKQALIVPKHVISRFGIEGGNASGLLHKLYTRPTTIWKHMILGYRPAYFVNNAVGNHLMYMMAHDPISVFRGYRDALRQVHSERAVTKSLHKADAVFKGQDFQNHYFKGQLTNTLADSTLGRTLAKGSKSRLGNVARQGFFGVTHNVADRMVRRATINNVIRDQPEFRAMLKKVGKEINPKTKRAFTPADAFNEAAHRVLKADHHGELRRYISGRVNDVMGDYHSYNPLEQKVKKIVPFYAWDRHIARHMKQLLNEKPWKADALAQVGKQGSQSNANLLGSVPQFMRGALPLSLLGLNVDHPSRKAVLSTTGLNPYATLPDAADALGAIFGHSSTGGGESIGNQLNPIINTVVEGLTGRSTLTGQPIKSSVPLPLRPYTDIAANLPQWKLLKSIVEGTPQPKPNKRTGKTTPFLFEKNWKQYLAQLMGVPVEQVSPVAAASMAKKQASGR